MEITIAFVLAQFMIGTIGYVIDQSSNIPAQRIIVVAFIISALIPLLSLNSLDELVQHYSVVLPSLAAGAGISGVVTVGAHLVREH